MAQPAQYEAIVFDLLTAVLDSWTLWNGGSRAAMARRVPETDL